MDNNPMLLKKINDGDNEAFDTMVSANMGLVQSIAMRFLGRGCEKEDLIQIGSIGLIKAIRKFDLSFGVKFSTYAVPMISGEIRRFLRDDGIIKVSRSIKETAYKGKSAENTIRQSTGREPTIDEVAGICRISTEELMYAYEACSGCDSLNEYINDSSEKKEDRLATASHEDETINKVLIAEALDVLNQKERQVIVLRYINGMTQSSISEIIGVSQVQISRIEKKALEKIRLNITEEF